MSKFAQILSRSGLIIVVGTMISCSSYFEPGQIESQLIEEIAAQTDLNVNQVVCPEKVAKQKDAVGVCTIQLSDGQSFEAQVTPGETTDQVNWDASQALETLKGIVDGRKLEQQIRNGIFIQNKLSVEVDCGKRFRIAHAGTSFQCIAIDPDNNEQREVQVNVQDEDGNVTWEL